MTKTTNPLQNETGSKVTKKIGYIESRLHKGFGIKGGGRVQMSRLGEGVIGCVLVVKDKSKYTLVEIEYEDSNA